jgi:hypothetical protein
VPPGALLTKYRPYPYYVINKDFRCINPRKKVLKSKKVNNSKESNKTICDKYEIKDHKNVLVGARARIQEIFTDPQNCFYPLVLA